MGINQAENRPQDAAINEINDLRREINAYRDNPQRIGNGSLNYAVFDPFSIGSTTIGAGLSANFTVTFMPSSLPFYYDAREAINRGTLFDFVFSVRVDVDDEAHTFPYGSALSGGQLKAFVHDYCDLTSSSFNEASGQRRIVMQILNLDVSNSHSYFIRGTALIPRPALKPQ